MHSEKLKLILTAVTEPELRIWLMSWRKEQAPVIVFAVQAWNIMHAKHLLSLQKALHSLEKLGNTLIYSSRLRRALFP